MNRRARVTTTAAVIAAMLAPVALDRDSFPLSTYPMYARVRSNEVTFVTAQGVDAAGHIQRLTLRTIGASDDPLIVAGELRAAIARGHAPERCEEIASRVNTGVEVVEIVSERHDVIDQVAGAPSLANRVVHARCAVEAP